MAPLVHCDTPMAPPPPAAFRGDTSPPPSLPLLALGLADMALDAYASTNEKRGKLKDQESAVGSLMEKLYSVLNTLLEEMDPSSMMPTDGASIPEGNELEEGDLKSPPPHAASPTPSLPPSVASPHPTLDTPQQQRPRLLLRSNTEISSNSSTFSGLMTSSSIGDDEDAKSADSDEMDSATPNGTNSPALFPIGSHRNPKSSYQNLLASVSFPPRSTGEGVVQAEWPVLYRTVQEVLQGYDTGFIGPLSAGTLPSQTHLISLYASAAVLAHITTACLRRMPKAHVLRMPLFALHVFASRIISEVARFQRTLEGKEEPKAAAADSLKNEADGDEDEDDDEEDEEEGTVGNMEKSAAQLLKEAVREVQGLWDSTTGQLYPLGVTNVALLSRYSALGRALRAVRDTGSAKSCYSLVLDAEKEMTWEDGMGDLRAVLGRKAGQEKESEFLGSSLKMGTISDYLWYAQWTGAEEGSLQVDRIPAEVPVSMILSHLGAPRSLESNLLVADRDALLRSVVPQFADGVQESLVKDMLAWTDGVLASASFELSAGRRSALGQNCPDKKAKASTQQKNRNQVKKFSTASGTSRQIPLEDILLGTNSWCPSAKIGEGAFGAVYKGASSKGEQWAVKRAKVVTEGSLDEFENEVGLLGKLRHQHLVRLYGHYADCSERILVYEYAEKGSLASFMKSKETSLTFQQRLSIAVGAAEGLKYLHSYCYPAVVHRDIKSDNILLTGDLQAKVADFGMLKVVGEGSLHTRVVGTPGYCDPEYSRTYKATDKSDVYSFGVVLLELLTGKRAVMEQAKKPHSFLRSISSGHKKMETSSSSSKVTLVSWALPLIQAGKMKKLLDPRLEGNFSASAAKAVAHIAMMCVQRNGVDRPGMLEVATRLSAILHRVNELELQPCSLSKFLYKLKEKKELSGKVDLYPKEWKPRYFCVLRKGKEGKEAKEKITAAPAGH